MRTKCRNPECGKIIYIRPNRPSTHFCKNCWIKEIRKSKGTTLDELNKKRKDMIVIEI